MRWGIGFALTWIDPFFAFYAAAGYMDADELIPGRWQRGRTVPRARSPWPLRRPAGCRSGAASSGSSSPRSWSPTPRARACRWWSPISPSRRPSAPGSAPQTIAELERTNAALQQALDENAALHAQLLVQAREAT